MEKIDFTKDFQKVCIALNKAFTAEDCEVYYMFLKDYKKAIFSKACEIAIQTCKFFPKVSEMLDFCEKAKSEIKLQVVSFMNKKGYFKCDKELEKTILFVKRNNIPSWLENDIQVYYKEMLGESGLNQITSQSGLLLS